MKQKLWRYTILCYYFQIEGLTFRELLLTLTLKEVRGAVWYGTSMCNVSCAGCRSTCESSKWPHAPWPQRCRMGHPGLLWLKRYSSISISAWYTFFYYFIDLLMFHYILPWANHSLVIQQGTLGMGQLIMSGPEIRYSGRHNGMICKPSQYPSFIF